MTWRTLIRRSLRHHWRAHLGVVLGAAVGSAALIGALVVGDSVRESLRERALARLYHVYAAMDTGDRFFTRNLFDRMGKINADRVQSSNSPVFGWRRSKNVPQSGYDLIHLPASISLVDGASRLNQISVFGTGSEFFTISLPGIARRGAVVLDHLPTLEQGETWVNSALAQQLNVHPGDTVILRIPKRNAFGGENPLAPRNDQTIALRLKVGGVLPASIGDLSLRSPGAPALNAFVNQSQLEEAAGIGKRANLLLARAAVRWRPLTKMEAFQKDFMIWRDGRGKNPFLSLHWLRNAGNVNQHAIGVPLSGDVAAAEASAMLAQAWTLADAECNLAPTSSPGELELRTSRIFLDPPLSHAARVVNTSAQPILTYLVNLLRAGTNTTPYSMVTAAGAPWTPADMRDNEIIVSQWLAEDLRVRPGDEIVLTYFDPESGARLAERTNTFLVRAIVPMEMPWADRTLMPEFPGIEKAESTSDWDAGFPLVHKIRQKDEDYWKQYRGTPKAFVTLAAGQKMWGNRFGNLTAIRFQIPTNAFSLAPDFSPVSGAKSAEKPFEAVSPSSETNVTGLKPGANERIEEFRAALEKKILANLKPEELGLRFEPVREQALKAAEESQDFGGLFLGFSLFVIAAALLLMALLFSLGLEQRAPEIGTLLALGFTPRQVRRQLLAEGVMLAFLGGVIGALGGLSYAKVMLHGLTTIWRDAVGASALGFHFTAQTLFIGIISSTVVGTVTIWLTLRRFVRRPARELLAGEIHADESRVQRVKSKVVASGALLAGVALAGWAVVRGDTANAGVFFGAGALVLVAGLGFVSTWLARRAGVAPVSDSSLPADGDRRDAYPTMASLAVRGCARRRKRSLATVAMLACGSFLIVSIGVFRLDANRDAWKRSSGTGGFALIGETTMPVVHDLNTASGRDFFALSERDLEGVSFVPFRVREGDEASCLNLNRAQKPRLLGVKSELIEGRFTFAKGSGWKSLINTGLQSRDRATTNSVNRLSGLPFPSEASTGLKPGANEIEIPAVGDANSIQWAMHKKVGDTIDYVDERGQPFKVRIVGAVANSILQGQLLIDEAEFVRRFPGESGYRMFLIDAPSNNVSQVSAALSRAMQDVGLELTPAAQRLAQFNAVQNTYLGTFQVLGGLGLLLGSVGLGIVVLRNVLERRGELAVLMAVGFRKPTLQRLLLIENGALLAAGLALGVVAAAVAVLPALLSPSAQLPYASLGLTLGAVLVNGALWTWGATRFAVRGDLLAALRNE